MVFAYSLRVVAKVILLRHAHSIANDKGILAGRLSGVHLSAEGHRQSEKLIARIGNSEFTTISLSPMQRCHDTVAPWLKTTSSKNLTSLTIEDGLNEVDYGDWSGRKLSTLSRDPLWKVIQSTPSKVTFPSGEKIAAMQKRAVATVLEKIKAEPKGSHLFVSHGDVIKSLIAHFLEMKLDNFQKLLVDPASISILDIDTSGARLTVYNDSESEVSRHINSGKSRKSILGGGAGLRGRSKK
jgi:probable phosphomutase (TIGR03848 family)